MDNWQVAHIWANHNVGNTPKDRARSSNGNLSFSGADLYSYSTVIGRFVKDDTGRILYVLVNTHRYSATTSGKHYPAMRSALHGLDVRQVPVDRINYLEPNKIVMGLIGDADELNAKAKRARSNADWYRDQAAVRMETARFVAEAHGLPFEDARQFLDAMIREREGRKLWHNLAAFFRDYHDATETVFERPLVALADIATGIEWLAGVGHYINGGPTLLRVNGDTVETSRGAEFPLAHGLKALPFIARAVREGRAYDFTPTREGLSHGPVRLGHFQIDNVSAAGWVRAGCHTVPGWAVRWAARQAGACAAPELDHVAEIVSRAAVELRPSA